MAKHGQRPRPYSCFATRDVLQGCQRRQRPFGCLFLRLGVPLWRHLHDCAEGGSPGGGSVPPRPHGLPAHDGRQASVHATVVVFPTPAPAPSPRRQVSWGRNRDCRQLALGTAVAAVMVTLAWLGACRRTLYVRWREPLATLGALVYSVAAVEEGAC